MRHAFQRFVCCPQGQSGQLGRRQKVDVDKPDTFSHQGVLINKKQEFVKFNRRGHWQGLQQGNNFVPVLQIPTGELADDKGMAHNLSIQ